MKAYEKWQQHRAPIFSAVVCNQSPPVDEPCLLCEKPAVIRLATSSAILVIELFSVLVNISFYVIADGSRVPQQCRIIVICNYLIGCR
jgi:hypothetical protein